MLLYKRLEVFWSGETGKMLLFLLNPLFRHWKDMKEKFSQGFANLIWERWGKTMKKSFHTLILFGVVLVLIQPALATITLVAEGTSAKGVDVRFEAELKIIDDILTIELINASPVASLNPDDVLGSFKICN